MEKRLDKWFYLLNLEMAERGKNLFAIPERAEDSLTHLMRSGSSFDTLLFGKQFHNDFGEPYTTKKLHTDNFQALWCFFWWSHQLSSTHFAYSNVSFSHQLNCGRQVSSSNSKASSRLQYFVATRYLVWNSRHTVCPSFMLFIGTGRLPVCPSHWIWGRCNC